NHPEPRRLRARVELGEGAAAGRPGRETRGEELIGEARPADPFDRRLHRSGLGRARHARAVERREPPDHDLLRDEDRADLVRAALRAGRDAVRLRLPRLEVPGAARPHTQPLLEELRAGAMILVTGATGFIGPKIVHALRAQSRDVRCLVRNPRGAATLRNWDCELLQGDVTDAASLRAAVASCETV